MKILSVPLVLGTTLLHAGLGAASAFSLSKARRYRRPAPDWAGSSWTVGAASAPLAIPCSVRLARR
jgi:hypothetical protein